MEAVEINLALQGRHSTRSDVGSRGPLQRGMEEHEESAVEAQPGFYALFVADRNRVKLEMCR
jgi:hypothetical protein